MNTNFTRELIEDFIIEGREHFDTIESNLIELEKNPADVASLQNVFRAFHTIKGNAALLKFQSITSLSHKAENMLAKIRDEARPADSETIDLILKITDILKNLVEGVESGGSIDYDFTAIFQRIDQAVNKAKQELPPPFFPPPPPPSPPLPPEILIQEAYPVEAGEGLVVPGKEESQEKRISVGKIHLSKRMQNDFHVISVAGRLDLQGSDILLKELIQISDGGGHKIALSLENSSYLSCCGLGALYATHQTLQEEGGTLKLSGVPRNAQEIIYITGLSEKMEVFDSLEDAIRGI